MYPFQRFAGRQRLTPPEVDVLGRLHRGYAVTGVGSEPYLRLWGQKDDLAYEEMSVPLSAEALRYPAFHPTEPYFVASSQTAIYVYKVDTEGAELVQTISHPSLYHIPCSKWSPSGKHFFISTHATNAFKIYRFDSQNESPLTQVFSGLPAGLTVAGQCVGDFITDENFCLAGPSASTFGVHLLQIGESSVTVLQSLGSTNAQQLVSARHDGRHVAVTLIAAPWVAVYRMQHNGTQQNLSAVTLSAATYASSTPLKLFYEAAGDLCVYQAASMTKYTHSDAGNYTRAATGSGDSTGVVKYTLTRTTQENKLAEQAQFIPRMRYGSLSGTTLTVDTTTIPVSGSDDVYYLGPTLPRLRKSQTYFKSILSVGHSVTPFIHAWGVNSDGVYTKFGAPDVAFEQWHITRPHPKELFIAAAGGAGVSVFTVDDDLNLKHVQYKPYPSGGPTGTPTDMVWSHSGKYLFVCRNHATYQVFKFDFGILTAITNVTLSAGTVSKLGMLRDNVLMLTGAPATGGKAVYLATTGDFGAVATYGPQGDTSSPVLGHQAHFGSGKVYYAAVTGSVWGAQAGDNNVFTSAARGTDLGADEIKGICLTHDKTRLLVVKPDHAVIMDATGATPVTIATVSGVGHANLQHTLSANFMDTVAYVYASGTDVPRVQLLDIGEDTLVPKSPSFLPSVPVSGIAYSASFSPAYF